MKLPAKERIVSTAVAAALAAVLVVLAALQYRWSREVSEAASARLKASLQTAMAGFRQDLYRELAGLCGAFQPGHPGEPGGGLNDYAQRYEQWSRTATHPGLVAGFYVLEDAQAQHPRLLRLNPATSQFEAAETAGTLAPLIQRLETISPGVAASASRFRHQEIGGGAAPGRFPRPEEHARFMGPWTFEQTVPALVHLAMPLGPGPEGPAGDAAHVKWVILEIDRKVLQQHLLPELTERYFSGSDGLEYNAVVLSGDDVIYSSDAEFGKTGAADADGSVNLFGMPPAPGPEMLQRRRQGPGFDHFRERHEFGFGMPHIEPMRASADSRDWQLLVKHRRGSLDAVVAGMRHRNLAVSFGVLLVLAATMAMILIATQRARRLAGLQMDFVTGVSHELRTPLAVISSAAENLADGVVENKQQITRYGAVIKKQAKQLNHLIEHILLFAATRQNRLQYSLRPLPVAGVIASALSNTGDLVHSAGFTVDQQVAPDLPAVMGDLPALSHCLQNLITNAVKYGGEDRWIGLRATASDDRLEVRISVEDHGAGIEHGQMQQIFEPFYRSPAAREAQIHGTGLGLTLARSIAEAMGGRLTVTSEPGKGSAFILHLRAADSAAVQEAAAPAEVSAGTANEKA